MGINEVGRRADVVVDILLHAHEGIVTLFLRDKKYADFQKDPDEAFNDVNNALLRITNRQTGRLESPDFHTDFAVDWKTGKGTNSQLSFMRQEREAERRRLVQNVCGGTGIRGQRQPT